MSGRKPDFRKAAAAIAAQRAGSVMAHPEVEDLVAYHSGDLPAGRVEALQAHLGVCRDCCEMVLELDRVECEERRPWTVLVESVARLIDPLRSAAKARASGSAGRLPQATSVWNFRAVTAVLAAGALAALLVTPMLANRRASTPQPLVAEIELLQMRGGPTTSPIPVLDIPAPGVVAITVDAGGLDRQTIRGALSGPAGPMDLPLVPDPDLGLAKVVLPTEKLPAGDYALELEDGAGRHQRYEFRVRQP
jgi:hypothetical protein